MLEREAIAVKLGHGCDFHMSYENIQEAKLDPAKFSINGLGYLLVEIPDYGISRGLTEIFYQLQLAGLTPILTHPERNPTLQSRSIADGGLAARRGAGAGDGRVGRWAGWENMPNAWRMICWRIAGFTFLRPMPTIRRRGHRRCARRLSWWRKKYGPDYAHLLCVSNPLAAFHGKAAATAAGTAQSLRGFEERRAGGRD